MNEKTHSEIRLELARVKYILAKHSLSIEAFTNLLSEESLEIPISIFKSKSGPLGALVLYLKSKGLRFSEIANLLNRDQSTIWTTYNKLSKKQFIEEPSISVPVEIFANRQLSIMEALTFYLKTVNNLRLVEIAKLISRSNKTIWCFYSRAKKKNG